jgi:hypothetical protein
MLLIAEWKENNEAYEKTTLNEKTTNEKDRIFRNKVDRFSSTYKAKDFPSRLTARDEIGASASFFVPISVQSSIFHTPM